MNLVFLRAQSCVHILTCLLKLFQKNLPFASILARVNCIGISVSTQCVGLGNSNFHTQRSHPRLELLSSQRKSSFSQSSPWSHIHFNTSVQKQLFFNPNPSPVYCIIMCYISISVYVYISLSQYSLYMYSSYVNKLHNSKKRLTLAEFKSRIDDFELSIQATQ